jgi:hypothetical protein
VDARVFVAGEADVAELARLARLDERRMGAVCSENAMWILVAENLVVLDQVDAVGLEATQGFFQLSYGLSFRPAVDFGHQEGFVPVTVAERVTHPGLAGAAVVVPAVVHEIDAAIDRAAHDAEAQLFIHALEAKVPASKAKRRDLLSRAAEDSIRHVCVH